MRRRIAGNWSPPAPNRLAVIMRDKAKPPLSEKSARTGNLSEGDLALWNRLAGTATPLPENRRAYHIAAAPTRAVPSKPARASGGKSAAPTPDRQVKTATPMRALSPEARIDPNLRRRLQKNRQPIEARLDLHGMTAAQAQKRLTQWALSQLFALIKPVGFAKTGALLAVRWQCAPAD